MIVVVLRILRRVRSPHQRDTAEVTLLVGKSPIFWFAHFRRLTLELTGTYLQRAARCTITRAPRGALQVRVRVERPVRRHRRAPC
jgi:hypothetical protein